MPHVMTVFSNDPSDNGREGDGDGDSYLGLITPPRALVAGQTKVASVVGIDIAIVPGVVATPSQPPLPRMDEQTLLAQHDESDPIRSQVLHVDIQSSSNSANDGAFQLQLPMPILAYREMEMNEAAVTFQIPKGRWNGSLLYNAWKRNDHMDNNRITVQPEKVCAELNYSQTFTWNQQLTALVQEYYQTGQLRVPNDCKGYELLLALEFFGILYRPDQMIFDTYQAYARVKHWSDYLTQRSPLAEWVADKVVNGGCCGPVNGGSGGGGAATVSSSSTGQHQHIFCTTCNPFEGFLELPLSSTANQKNQYKALPAVATPPSTAENDHASAQSIRLTPLLGADGGITASTLALYYSFFNSSAPAAQEEQRPDRWTGMDQTVGTDPETAHAMRKDFCSYLQNILTNVHVCFPVETVHVQRPAGAATNEEGALVQRAVLTVTVVQPDSLNGNIVERNAHADSTKWMLLPPSEQAVAAQSMWASSSPNQVIKKTISTASSFSRSSQAAISKNRSHLGGGSRVSGALSGESVHDQVQRDLQAGTLERLVQQATSFTSNANSGGGATEVHSRSTRHGQQDLSKSSPRNVKDFDLANSERIAAIAKTADHVYADLEHAETSIGGESNPVRFKGFGELDQQTSTTKHGTDASSGVGSPMKSGDVASRSITSKPSMTMSKCPSRESLQAMDPLITDSIDEDNPAPFHVIRTKATADQSVTSGLTSPLFTDSDFAAMKEPNEAAANQQTTPTQFLHEWLQLGTMGQTLSGRLGALLQPYRTAEAEDSAKKTATESSKQVPSQSSSWDWFTNFNLCDYSTLVIQQMDKALDEIDEAEATSSPNTAALPHNNTASRAALAVMKGVEQFHCDASSNKGGGGEFRQGQFLGETTRRNTAGVDSHFPDDPFYDVRGIRDPFVSGPLPPFEDLITEKKKSPATKVKDRLNYMRQAMDKQSREDVPQRVKSQKQKQQQPRTIYAFAGQEQQQHDDRDKRDAPTPPEASHHHHHNKLQQQHHHSELRHHQQQLHHHHHHRRSSKSRFLALEMESQEQSFLQSRVMSSASSTSRISTRTVEQDKKMIVGRQSKTANSGIVINMNESHQPVEIKSSVTPVVAVNDKPNPVTAVPISSQARSRRIMNLFRRKKAEF